MSGEQDQSQKTEEPTSKRLEEAQEQGDLLQSTDLVALAMFAAATALLGWWAPAAM
ncbi:MAG TPA: flagellar biosynthesis protein FlhB, partial [Alphaproteobacteria bacterium]|nr:flagellar biosynthesis protein FlhB [Alphaproteobacteria bacterium]